MNLKGKKLYRSTSNAWIAGVIGGVAEYTGYDATMLRLLAVIGLIITGFFPGVFIYAVAWIMVPREEAVRVHDVDAK